ncbi:MAG: hypothetical protein EBZ48_03460 [Proteobacteria bacterium]|nr:hypothetical protein [Pseudomonadota bacterium]
MKRPIQILVSLLLMSAACSEVFAQSEADRPPTTVAASPKTGWAAPPKAEEPSSGRKILLWLPNRIMDFLDIFRVDVGVGPSAGGVVRVTKYAQAGYRQMLPMSARVGLMGRRPPVMLETNNEIGVGPIFMQNSKRKVCVGEVGLGLDLFIAGGYAGICLDEAVDFVSGIFTVDTKDDDFQ